MKNILVTALLIPMLSLRTPPARQILEISNLGKIKGTLYIGWYKSAEEFRKPDKAALQKIVKVEGKESVEVIFENVPPGTYAIAVFLDKNGNGKIDTNIFGIPKEKYGFSNNRYPLTRAATFEESAFKAGNSEQKISVKLKG